MNVRFYLSYDIEIIHIVGLKMQDFVILYVTSKWTPLRNVTKSVNH